MQSSLLLHYFYFFSFLCVAVICLVCLMSRVFYLSCTLHMVSQAARNARGGVKERVTHAWHIPNWCDDALPCWSTANWDAVGQEIFLIAIFVPFSQLALCDRNIDRMKYGNVSEIFTLFRPVYNSMTNVKKIAISFQFICSSKERGRERFLVRWEHKSNCRTWDKCLRTLIKMFNEMNSLIKRRLCRGA